MKAEHRPVTWAPGLLFDSWLGCEHLSSTVHSNNVWDSVTFQEMWSAGLIENREEVAAHLVQT